MFAKLSSVFTFLLNDIIFSKVFQKTWLSSTQFLKICLVFIYDSKPGISVFPQGLDKNHLCSFGTLSKKRILQKNYCVLIGYENTSYAFTQFFFFTYLNFLHLIVSTWFLRKVGNPLKVWQKVLMFDTGLAKSIVHLSGFKKKT